MADATKFQFTGVAAPPRGTQDAFFTRLRDELSKLLQAGKVVGEMVSNIIVARRPR